MASWREPCFLGRRVVLDSNEPLSGVEHVEDQNGDKLLTVEWCRPLGSKRLAAPSELLVKLGVTPIDEPTAELVTLAAISLHLCAPPTALVTSPIGP